MNNTTLPLNNQGEQKLADFLKTHKFSIAMGIMALILVIILASTFFRAKYSLKTPQKLSNSEVLAMLPNPQDAQEKPISGTTEEKQEPSAENEEKSKEEQLADGENQPVYAVPIIEYKPDYSIPHPITQDFEIMTLAPQDYSRVAGKHFYIALSFNKNCFAWVESVESYLTNGTIRRDNYETLIPNQSQFRSTYTLPVQLPSDTIKVKITLRAQDLDNQLLTQKLIYWK